MTLIGQPDPCLVDQVRQAHAQWRCLEAAVRWGLEHGAEIDVIAQDEFTHDVRMVLAGGTVVLDST